MPRLVCVLFLASACAPAIAPGGGHSSSDTGASLVGGTVVTATTPPYHEPHPDDGTLGLVAPTTRIFPDAGTLFTGRMTVGDFDGDGHADLAYETATVDPVTLESLTFQSHVWYGPLPAGDLEAGAATVLLRQGRLGGAADIDNDGTDELGLYDAMLAIPGDGVYDDPALLSVARIGAVTGPFADFDQDGYVDSVGAGFDAVVIVYGPLATADYADTFAPSPTTALIRDTNNCEFAGSADVLPDLAGDGLPGLWISDLAGQVGSGNMGCAAPSAILIGGGDHRGRAFDLTFAVQGGLDNQLSPIGDVDGDGLPELATPTGIYHTRDLYTAGASAAPFAWAGLENAVGWRSPFPDVSGDGKSEAVVGGYALDGATVTGELTQAIGQGLDPYLTVFQIVAEVTGDDVADGLMVGSDVLWIFSGAELARRWTPPQH